MAKKCEYCGSIARLVKGDFIYPHRPDLSNKNFYYCDNNHEPAYVGCHSGTEKPLGRLANSELRKAKSTAHQAFDPLWKGKCFRSRGKAYSWLANTLRIEKHKCHIGMFNIDQCSSVVKACLELEKTLQDSS